MTKKRWLAVAVAVSFAAFSRAGEVPKNIVLMIGDGMGASHLTAGKIAKGDLNIERMPVGGMVTTFAAGDLVTDSAAAATALATGNKTNNGKLSVSPDGKPLKTVFEYARESGKARGLAVTCSVTHATPAGFVAHVASRSENNAIAEDVAKAELDVLFGGGFAYFIPKSMPDSAREDDKNLLDTLAKRMQIVIHEREFAGIDVNKPAAALLAMKHPAPSNERELKLSEMVSKALEILSKDEDGFMLLVEGSQIDWFAHKRNAEGVISETEEFDDAVGVALDFAEKNKDTLVVVTADHETGGMAITAGSREEKQVTKADFVSSHHTAEMVPLFAFGPGSEAFGGLKDNTDIGKQLIEYVK